MCPNGLILLRNLIMKPIFPLASAGAHNRFFISRRATTAPGLHTPAKAGRGAAPFARVCWLWRALVRVLRPFRSSPPTAS